MYVTRRQRFSMRRVVTICPGVRPGSVARYHFTLDVGGDTAALISRFDLCCVDIAAMRDPVIWPPPRTVAPLPWDDSPGRQPRRAVAYVAADCRTTDGTCPATDS